MSNYEPHHFNLMLTAVCNWGRNMKLISLECIVSITDYSSSSGPTDTPVHANILYQVYILLYCVRFACMLTHAWCTLNAFSVWGKMCIQSLIKTTFILSTCSWGTVRRLSWKNVNSMQSFQLQHATFTCKKNKTFHNGTSATLGRLLHLELGFSIQQIVLTEHHQNIRII